MLNIKSYKIKIPTTKATKRRKIDTEVEIAALTLVLQKKKAFTFRPIAPHSVLQLQ